MPLQTMFALYSLLPAITASVAAPVATPRPAAAAPTDVAMSRSTRPSGPRDGVTRTTITIHGGRTFAAKVFAPNSGSSDSRYPGAVIIATEETRDRAFTVANTMATIGVTVIMYTQEPYSTRRLLMRDAYAAVDSMRRRYDVRREEIGVIAFEEATVIVPDLVRDTSLSFAIAASGDPLPRYVNPRYTVARAATLLVQGVDSLKDPTLVAPKDVTNVAQKPKNPKDPLADQPPVTLPPGTPSPFDAVPVPPPAPDTAALAQATADQGVMPGGDPADSLITEILDAASLSAPSKTSVPPNITVWPVPRSQLETIGEAHSPLGVRVVSWLREQVHANPVVNQARPIVIH